MVIKIIKNNYLTKLKLNLSLKIFFLYIQIYDFSFSIKDFDVIKDFYIKSPLPFYFFRITCLIFCGSRSLLTRSRLMRATMCCFLRTATFRFWFLLTFPIYSPNNFFNKSLIFLI